ncbi:MAG: hypothetical protein HY301_17160 [Verrucomicrobia bacterium]|nr:hypothetical protein [Verrucomicrobiota bacterium]
MKFPTRTPAAQGGYALIMSVVFMAVALLALGGALNWTASNSMVNERHNQYFESLYAAEAATEKVVARMATDFRNGDQARVFNNVASYVRSVPTSAEHTFWDGYVFSDDGGTVGQLTVSNVSLWSTNAVTLASQYAGLYGFAATYHVSAHARVTGRLNDLTASVAQDLHVATIPLFQYAAFFGVQGEISCGSGTILNIRGKVHGNDNIFLHPDGTLNFFDDVTSVGYITTNQAAPGNGTSGGKTTTGTITFAKPADTGVASITLPIGTSPDPTNVIKVLDPPPAGEDRNSGMGLQRFYNKADLIISVTNVGALPVVNAKYVDSTGIETPIAGGVTNFVNTGSSFYDNRETKTIRPVNIDVGKLKAWNATNTALRGLLSGKTGGDVRILYVQDQRTSLTGSELSAVRVTNGAALPPQGLTIATDRPLYIQGHYNGTNNAYYGTSNTSASLPAAFVADAINVLSAGWTDSNSTNALASRNPVDTTVNAAFLAGNVKTTLGNPGVYSGGLENFPRFHENWGGSRTITINGSMVILFNSRYATQPWGKGNVYNPPSRNYFFDQNFLDARKLPPGTPAASVIIRTQWAAVKPVRSN